MSTSASADTLRRIQDIYEQGLYLQAYEASKELGPIQDWREPEAQILGGRMASHLGALRLGRVMHRRAYAQNPRDPEAVLFYLFAKSQRLSPLELMNLMDQHAFMDEAPAGPQADWHALRARLLASLRDFEAAEDCINRALDLQPERSWIWVERVAVYELEDRREEALASAEKALELRPMYRPAVQTLAHRLVQLNRDEEALKVLGEAAEKLESAGVLTQLAALHHELEHFEESREVITRVAKYWPLKEVGKAEAKWLEARLADAAYYCGDIQAACEHAKKVDMPFFTRIAERLQDDSVEAKRADLRVKFVQQNHLTCAPATLSAISDYWSKPVSHLEVSEEICYDGTPAHSERRWAVQNGYVVREFRVTWDSAVALIDRGVPFTLTTVDPGSAHLQAVVGYDNLRGSLIVRDPGERHTSEFAANEMLEHYDSSGPRGMALAPKEQAEKLDGIEFPDAELYDLYYELEIALEGHNRDQAASWHAKMVEQDPEHRLTLRARGNLAKYDSDWNALLNVIETLLVQYPKDVNLILTKHVCLQELDRQQDAMEWLDAQVAKPDCNPLFWIRHAQELVDDARQQENVEYLVRQSMRHRPQDGLGYHLLGEIQWQQGRREEAVQLFRWYACLEEMNEFASANYFKGARCIDRQEVVLEFLEDRYRRAGEKSAWPARTLSWAYDQLERVDDAIDTLRQALKTHPEDGELLLYAAGFFGRYGNFEEARKLLETAKPLSRHVDWLRQLATVELYHGDLSACLAVWQQVLEIDPLDYSAQDTVASLLADLHDVPTAVAHLRAAVQRFPHSLALNVLLIEWLRDDKAACEKMLRPFLESNPNSAWARRELATALYSQQRYDESLQELLLAEEVEPSHHLIPFLRGKIAEAQGDIEAARQQYRLAVQVSVDFDAAMLALIETCDAKEDRVRELQFVFSELKSQVTFGEGILTFRTAAERTFAPEQVLDCLNEARAARPDLWHSWSAVVRQLCDMDRSEEALPIAEQASQKFAFQPGIWMDLALACSMQKKFDDEIKALEFAWRINPNWSEPARILATALENKGDIDKAQETLRRAISSEPKNCQNHAGLATLLWNQEQKEEAVEYMEAAVRMQPRYQPGWDALREWYDELQRPDDLAKLAREVVEKRPKDAGSWLLLGEALTAPEQAQEAHQALDKAIEINPRLTDAYNRKACYLARDGEIAEAVEACNPSAFRGAPPLELQSREAWIYAMQGDLPVAREKIHKVVQEDPEYFWAWQQLCEWTDGLQDEAELHYEAAQNLARIAPQYGPAWGYLANAELQREDPQAAMQFLQRALDLNPDYPYAIRTLIELQFEAELYKEAEQTLELGGAYLRPGHATSYRGRLAAYTKDKVRALACLEELSFTATDGHYAMDTLGAAIWKAGWGVEAGAQLEPHLTNPQSQPAVGYVWTHMETSNDKWSQVAARLGQLDPGLPTWAAACSKFLEEAAEDGGKEDLARTFIAQHGPVLRANDETWGEVLRAFNSLEDYQAVRNWGSDWQSHTQADPWAYIILILAHWNNFDPQAANEVAVSRLQAEETEADAIFMVWAGLYELLLGDVPKADAILDSINVNDLPVGFHLDCWYLFSNMASMIAQGQPYASALKDIQQIHSEIGEFSQKDPIVKWVMRRYPERLAFSQNRILTTLWLSVKRMFESKPKRG